MQIRVGMLTASINTILESPTYRMLQKVPESKLDLITTICINIEGAVFAKGIEAENSILIITTVSGALWDSPQLAGADPSRINA